MSNNSSLSHSDAGSENKFAIAHFVSLRREELFRALFDEFIDVFACLADAKVSPESTGVASELRDLLPSWYLFGEEYAEIDRSVLSVLALQWIMNSDFDKFKSDHPNLVLTRPTFCKLRNWINGIIQTDNQLYDLIHLIMINDLGKSACFINSIKLHLFAEGIDATGMDHDRVAYEGALRGHIPSLNSTDPAFRERRDILLSTLELAAHVNLAQWAQAETVTCAIEYARRVQITDYALALKFIEILCDVAGATGAFNPTRISTLTEPYVTMYFGMFDAMAAYKRHKIDSTTCYETVLTFRTPYVAHEPHVATLVRGNRYMYRLLAMSRAWDKESTSNILNAIRTLSPVELDALQRGLDMGATLPYYTPALFALIFHRKKKNIPEEQLTRMLRNLLIFLARALDEEPTAWSPHLMNYAVCDLGFARDLVMSAEFEAEPERLLALEIPVARYAILPPRRPELR